MSYIAPKGYGQVSWNDIKRNVYSTPSTSTHLISTKFNAEKIHPALGLKRDWSRRVGPYLGLVPLVAWCTSILFCEFAGFLSCTVSVFAACLQPSATGLQTLHGVIYLLKYDPVFLPYLGKRAHTSLLLYTLRIGYQIIMATGNFFWAPTLGLGNTATMQTLNWQALRCPRLPTAYSDLNWMKGWAVSERSSRQLIPARLARLAHGISMDERHGESEGLPREQRAVCWEIRADASWGSSGLIPAPVIKRVKASDTCRLTQQEVAGETLPLPTGWIMSQCPKVRDVFIHRKIVTVTMITPVHLDSFIQHFF